MAHEDLGNVVGNLGAAQDAVNRNRKAIGELEKDADKRKARLAEEEAAENKRLENVTRRGGEQRAVRRQEVASVREEAAAIEAGEAQLARETGAVEANTRAHRANAAARREAASSSARGGLPTSAEREVEAEERRRQALPPNKGGYRYPGAFAPTTAPPAYATAAEREAAAAARAAQDPKVYGPIRDPFADFMARKFKPPADYEQRARYREIMGREPGPNVPIGVTGGIGDKQIKLEGENVDQISKTYAKYANQAGFIKAAKKAQAEEARAAAQAEKELAAASEQSAATQVAASEKVVAANEAAIASGSVVRGKASGKGVGSYVVHEDRGLDEQGRRRLLVSRNAADAGREYELPFEEIRKVRPPAEAASASAKTQVAASEQVAAAKKAEAEAVVAANEEEIASEEKRTFKWAQSPRSPGTQRLVGTPYRVSEFAEDKFLLQQKKGRGFDVLDTYPTAGEARIAAHKRVLAEEAKATSAEVVVAAEAEATATAESAAAQMTSIEEVRAARKAAAADLRNAQARFNRQESATARAGPNLAESETKLAERGVDLQEARTRHTAFSAREQQLVDERLAERRAQTEARKAAIPAPPVVVKSDTPEGFYQAEQAQRGARAAGGDLGTVTGDLTPARRAVKASPVYREKAREQARELEEGAAEEEKAVKRARAVKKEVEEVAEQPIIPSPVGGGGGGRRPPSRITQTPLGGGGGGGGGGDDGIKKLVTDEEKHAENLRRIKTLEGDYATIQQKTIAGYASSSQALQRHGALTAEFISGLVRGEVTLKEFQSQLAITIGKFAGWAVAGGLVYGAYEAIKHLSEGVVHTQTGVEQLKRSLGEKVNVPRAEEGFRKLSAEINVPIGGSEDSASTAQFYAARVYHDQTQSLELASIALKAYKLDNVNAQDAVKSFGAVAVAFSLGPKQLASVFDELDVGQLKFNARLNQTLPAVARASASFAAAGGTVKELVTQMIEIYRATGGGGGTGGGNPATALLREPANLTRPESARVLERYGFDAKYAREHIGQFNREVQIAAKAGKFPGGQPAGEQDLQALAKAAGAGAGVGYRYLLPLFRLGKTSLPEEVISETEKAKGSAAEDLKHKLAQLDEQFTKIGIDVELFGSKLGGTGIAETLKDLVGGLNLAVKGAGLVIEPFAKLGQVLSSLPTPIRQIAEAAGLVYVARRVGRSELGLSARTLAGESGLFPTYKGGGAPELRSVTTAQSKYLERVRNAQEAAFAEASIVGPTRIAPARRAYEEFAAKPVPLDEKDQVAYYAERDRLEKRYLAALERGTELSARATALQAEALAVEERINLLRNKRMSVQARLLAAEEAGLFGVAAGGTPSSGAVLAPNAARAAEEQERIAAATAANTFGRSPGGVILPPGARTPPPLAGGAAFASGVPEGAVPHPTGGWLFRPDSARQLETTSAAAERSYSYLAGTYLIGQNAASKLAPIVDEAATRSRALAGKVGRTGIGLASFARGLGPLGVAVAAFAGLDLLNRVTGSSKAAEEATSKLESLKFPTSEATLQTQLQKGHKAGFFDSLTKGFGEVVTNLYHEPINELERILTENAGGGKFRFEKVEQAEKEATKKLAEGKYKGLGSGTGLSDAYLGTQTNIAEEAFSKLEKASSSEDVEKTLKNVNQQVKLRLEEFKSFGAGTKFGDEDIAVLQTQVHGAVTAFGLSGNTNIFEGMLSLEEKLGGEVAADIQKRVQLVAKYGSKKEFASVYQKGQAQLRSNLTKGHAEGVADVQQEYDDQVKKLAYYQAAEKRAQQPPKAPTRAFQLGSDLTARSPLLSDVVQRTPDFYKDLANQTRVKINSLKQNLERLGLDTKQVNQVLHEGQAQIAHAAFEERVPAIRARGALRSARAGANKLLKAQAAAKTFAEELALADELRVKGLSRADVIGKQTDQIAAEDAERQEAIIGARLEGIGRRTGLDVSRLPSKDAVGRAQREEEGARKELEYVHGKGRHAAYPSAGAKKAAEEDAETRLNNARNSAGDARESAAKEGERSKKSEEAKQHHEEAKQKREEANRRYQEGVEAHAELRESLTEDPIKLDHIALDRDKKLLKGVSGIEAIRKKAAINRDFAKLHNDEVSEKERDIDVNLQLEKINQSTAISLYKSLLGRKNLTKQVRQDLQLKIKGLEKGEGGEAEKDFGRIAFAPTGYDVQTLGPLVEQHRRATSPTPTLSGGGPRVIGQSAQPTTVAHVHHHSRPQFRQNNTIQIVVNGAHPGRFASEMERVFGSLTRSQMRSAGLV